jgi:hypothetical protein
LDNIRKGSKWQKKLFSIVIVVVIVKINSRQIQER